jgi:hypothetical protein
MSEKRNWREIWMSPEAQEWTCKQCGKFHEDMLAEVERLELDRKDMMITISNWDEMRIKLLEENDRLRAELEERKTYYGLTKAEYERERVS